MEEVESRNPTKIPIDMTARSKPRHTYSEQSIAALSFDKAETFLLCFTFSLLNHCQSQVTDILFDIQALVLLLNLFRHSTMIIRHLYLGRTS